MEGERKSPRRVGHPMNDGGHRSPLESEFDPLTTLMDGEPGEWLVGRGHDEPYAVIRLVEVGGERGYRVVTWAPLSEDRRLVGYMKTLRGAARLAQRDRMKRATLGGYWEGPPKAGWGGAPDHGS